MKAITIQAKTEQSNHSNAGCNGAAAAPPSYGIDFLDRWQPNRTGLPDRLKANVENLSGMSMDNVRVHYNSSKPAQLQALAYTQGMDIHVGAGQEKHLAHEAWHVVQQAQGRVQPTMQMKGGTPVNNDKGLEHEADVMGGKALQAGLVSPVHRLKNIQGQATVAQCLPKLKNQREAIEYFEDYLSEDTEKYAAEIQELIALGGTKKWGDLQERISYYLEENNAKQGKKASAIVALEKAKGNKSKSRQLFDDLDKSDPASLPRLITLLESAKENDWTDLEELILPFVHRLEDERDYGIDERDSGISKLTIEQVMGIKDLKEFIAAQDLFQSNLTNMDGLQSAGYEFEFASFKEAGTNYDKREIIPSHQLMGKALLKGNFFKLEWRLESDSENTLELVTPPLVFPKNATGNGQINAKEKEIETAADRVAGQLQNTTLPQTASLLGNEGLGQGWTVKPAYQRYEVVKKVKSGPQVYGQKNVSMYPEEIGELLLAKFAPYKEAPVNVLEPEGMAIGIHRELTAKAENPTPAANQGMAIFARYCSNAMAIPSMRVRQTTGIRKETTPTQIKESLGIWVKTDALNLLKPILAMPDDQAIFKRALLAAKPKILADFTRFGEYMTQTVTPPPNSAPVQPVGAITLRDAVMFVMQRDGLLPGDKTIMPKAQSYLQEKNAQIPALNLNAPPPVPEPVRNMIEFNKLMMDEVNAFINRALLIDTHQESVPTSTTEQFLQEEYGSGGGVRKGTYIRGVPTRRGNMYVTEIRPQM